MLKNAVMVDLDGTLFDTNHRQHLVDKGDWDGFHSLHTGDEPILPMIQMVKSYIEHKDYHVVFVTGRTVTYEESTIKQLNHYFNGDYSLRMRQEGDYRPAATFKREVVSNYLLNTRHLYKPSIAFDDHKACIEMYTNLGFVTCHVAQKPKEEIYHAVSTKP